MNTKVFVLLCAALISCVSGYVLLSKGTDTVRTLKEFNEEAGSGSNGIIIIMTSRTQISAGTYNYTRTWIQMNQSPCPRVTMKRYFGTYSVTSSLTDSDAVNEKYEKVAQSVVMPIVFLSNQTSGAPQLGDIAYTLPLCQSSKVSLTWTNFIVNTYVINSTVVYDFYKCATIISASDVTFGQVCFNFSIANDTYYRNGVKTYPGQIKIDKTFMPSAAVVGLYSTLKPGVVAIFTASSDAGTVTRANDTTTGNDTGSSVTMNADVEVSYSSGAVSFLSYNKTANAMLNGTSVGSVAVTKTEISAADATSSFSMVVNGNSLSVSGQNSKVIYLFGFDIALSAFDTLVWDPATGYSDASANGSLHASVGAFALVFMAIIALAKQ